MNTVLCMAVGDEGLNKGGSFFLYALCKGLVHMLYFECSNWSHFQASHR